MQSVEIKVIIGNDWEISKQKQHLKRLKNINNKCKIEK